MRLSGGKRESKFIKNLNSRINKGISHVRRWKAMEGVEEAEAPQNC